MNLWRFGLFSLVALVALFALPLDRPANAANVHGDVDCDGVVDSVDALKVQRHVAGLSVSQTEPCPNIGDEVASFFGDVDCDNDIDAVDSLKILRFVAGLSSGQEVSAELFVSQTNGCPAIGSVAPSGPIISSLGCSPTPAFRGQEVTCDPSVVGSVTSYSWTAPGGSPSSGSGVSFSTTYRATAGTKVITLQACNDSDCSTKSLDISVGEPQKPVIDSLGCSPTVVRHWQTVTCNPSIVGPVTWMSWSAPGGSPGSGSEVSFSTRFKKDGMKTITLQLCNFQACSEKLQSILVV